jgi:SAM-dependent methyltransferase
MNTYDDSFFNYIKATSDDSAMAIVPMVYEVFKPHSILDIGCGTGAWLHTFQSQYQIDDILGVDGDYVKEQFLRIPKDKFKSYDLKNYYEPGRQYDLAMSVEVGEHLPDSSADLLVKSLVQASRAVMFSAALPLQGGTYHINEQNPEYWAEKFAAHGYVCIDYLRPKIWDNNSIYYWYRQNILFYIHKDDLGKYPMLQKAYEKTDPSFLRRIHPEMILNRERDIQRLKNPAKNIRHQLYLFKQKLKGA